MGKRTETKTIDGVQIETTQFAVMRSLSISARWMRALTPGLGILAPLILRAAGNPAASTAAFQSLMSDTNMLATSLTALFNTTSDAELHVLVKDTLSCTVVTHDGRRETLDSKEKIDLTIPTLKHLVEILSFVLGVNYDNFFVSEPSTESG